MVYNTVSDVTNCICWLWKFPWEIPPGNCANFPSSCGGPSVLVESKAMKLDRGPMLSVVKREATLLEASDSDHLQTTSKVGEI